jgi:hypothetical protein
VLCLAGKYKASSGSAACTDCPVNSISFSTNCQCKVGFMADGGTCSSCSAGKFKATTCTDSCTTCPANTSSVGFILTNPSENLRFLSSHLGFNSNAESSHGGVGTPNFGVNGGIAIANINTWCLATSDSPVAGRRAA